jgi:hypothetical protein
VSDIVVEAITTSAFIMASATAGGSSSPWRDLGSMVITITSHPKSLAASKRLFDIEAGVEVSTTIRTLSPRFTPKHSITLLAPFVVMLNLIRSQ